ncbi:M23 family metallopeptidase [Peptoniphilus ovalis]|nr:M23 family metallopeptidase [Peptoniphilus ovalis]
MSKAFVRHPYAKVEFATETGELTIFQKTKINESQLDLNILSIETKRDIGSDDCATFSITLVYKEEWYNSIGGNDLVIIRLGDGENEKPIFYGMVDSIYESESYPDLIATRSLVISGRGFNKALIQFGIGAITDLQTVEYTTGFFPHQIDVMFKNSPAKIIETAYNHYTENGIDINFANGESYKSLARTIFKDNPEDNEASIGDEQFYTQYQGGLWEFLKELRNAPFYEIYWEIEEDKPTLIVRPTPFNPEEWNDLPEITVKNTKVVSKNLGRSDLETYTCFVVKGETAYSGIAEMFGRPLWYPPFYKKYGLRRLQVNSKYNYVGDVPQISVDGASSDGIATTETTDNAADKGGTFLYPLPNARLTSKFGKRTDPVYGTKGKQHNGIDLATDAGTAIPCVGDGVVKQVGYNNISGHWIEVQHTNGLVTRYQHCLKKPPLLKGEKVTRGQIIGQVGSTGKSTGPHLHFEVKKNGKAVDPLPYLEGKGNSGSGGKGGPNDTTTEISKVDMSTLLNGPSIEGEKEKLKDNIKEFGGKPTQESINRAQQNYVEGIIQNAINNPWDSIFNQKSYLDYVIEESENQVEERLNRVDELLGSNEGNEFASKKVVNLFNWNIHNNQMENGNITLIGDAKYKIGDRLLLEETDMEYYIENVSHSFTYNESWLTSLQVTRGMKKGTRFDAPWNQYKIMDYSDMQSITGVITPADSNADIENYSDNNKASNNTDGLSSTRKNLVNTFLSKAGETYSQGKRMEDGYSDCSSFVYKRTCEALGISYKGKWAPSSSSIPSWEQLYEISFNEALPGDVLWRPGHTEFVSDEGINGRSFGAHKPGTPAGYGGKIKNGKWQKCYRIKGIN